MAVLYLFLSTFATLTHTHDYACSNLSPETSRLSAAARPAAGPALVAGSIPTPSECSFCVWQAAGVSAALPVQTYSGASILVALVPDRLPFIPHSPPTSHSSSRAPPLTA